MTASSNIYPTNFSPGSISYRGKTFYGGQVTLQDYDSKYTVVQIDGYLPSEGQMDFQIEALIGYEQGIVTYPGVPGTAKVITGETSGWSNTQTITIQETSTSPSPNPTPTVPEFSSWTIPLLLSIILASAGLLAYHKRKQSSLVKKAWFGHYLLFRSSGLFASCLATLSASAASNSLSFMQNLVLHS